MPERDIDVVVFGATGVTGRQVAKYLSQRSAAGAGTWAAAARDPSKLDRVLGEAEVEGAQTMSADLADAESLASMASRATVVLDLVGPYAEYGRPVIEACVSEGAHYLDLSGEIPFVSDVIVDFGARAEQAGVKIVQVCGFEALPPDMAVALAAEAARERWDEPLAEVDLELTFTPPPGMPRPSDVISGGTIQSIAGIAGAPNAAAAVDPAALIDDPGFASAVRTRSPIKVAPRRNSRGAVLAPMTPAAFINPAVMHRTAELSGASEPFRYREGLAIPGPEATLPLRYAVAGAMSAAQAGIAALARSPRQGMRTRIADTMSSVLPDSGFGPAADRLEDWKWGMRVDGRTAAGNEVRVDADADGHPGYLATARMLGEAGLLLAEKGATPDVSGCVTPAVALGTVSAPRFEAAKLRFSVSP
ncbi:MAG: saccharopine dehydrogenase NADP-binding domain-containing protein [Solirubrobacterales bacterium]|nr:saccharopine dehydrogenase NADP-binding domain-containing protein [Solirubrobacterales bacterium]